MTQTGHPRSGVDMNRPAIRIRNLVKTFRRRGRKGETITPVDNISIDIGYDDFVVLLGPSGCGKTTLLRCVAGLEYPDSGEIEIGGKVVFSSERGILVPPEKRDVNMIFQSYALWPHMTVFENVAYPLRSHGASGDEIRDRVIGTLNAVGLESLESQYPSQISGGQQQRVALARAIVGRDGVILFDEPLSNVDAKVREQLRLELLSIKRQIGFSALYVTHDQHEAMNLATKIAVLNNGRIAQFDQPETIYHRPTNAYVANFIGATNMLEGQITSREANRVLARTEVGEVEVAIAADSPFVAGDRVRLVSRPESWILSAESEGHRPNRWPVVLRERIFSGPHIEYIVRAKDRDLLIWSPTEVIPARDMSSGWASIAPESIHLIPKDSEA